MASGNVPLNPFSRGDVLAQTGAGASMFDALAIDSFGVPESVLMENAGRSAALVVQYLYRPNHVVAFVGAGNNGGDALVFLRTMASWGVDVTAVMVADRSASDPLLHGWPVQSVIHGVGVNDDLITRALREADVIADGILGTGTRGAPRQRETAAIRLINASDTPVVSLDIPSGADATSGATPGEVVKAELTVSFGVPKTGALLYPARACVGRHVTLEIGLPPLLESDAGCRIVTPQWVSGQLPVRETNTHKNRVGRLLIVGGAMGMAGAVILAARGAFHAGAGFVQVCSSAANRELVQAAIPEAIFIPADDLEALREAAAQTHAVVVGPGLGTGLESEIMLDETLGQGSQPILLDADALNLAAQGSISLRQVGSMRPVLITPHYGEMTRLAPKLVSADSRLDVARALAYECAISVLLKGAPSIVASPAQPILFDTQGSSDLAVAGMGDMLSGVCGALMAQGLEPTIAGAVGLYLCGRAARISERGAGLMPSDVSERIPDVLLEKTDVRGNLPFPFVVFDAEADQ
tara:strand:+ start:3955 stop:5529 length:1575 start_codon:yes stop_codon:yes gene_type:complete